MMIRHRELTTFVSSLAVLACFAATSRADDKQKALAWLDDYSEVQVLFHDKDIKRVREKLEAATSAQATEWLEQTAEIRNALDNSEWKSTRNWLKEFLKVQAIYSDKQIEEFRQKVLEAAEKSPSKFKELLGDVETKRARLAKGAAASAAVRKQMLAMNEHYRQEMFEQREAARKTAATESASATTRTQTIRNYEGAPPLINSIDAARWSVMRNFWPRW